jgi:hypothetical protein
MLLTMFISRAPQSNAADPRLRQCGLAKTSADDLVSDQLPFGRFCYVAITHAVDYAKFYSRSHPLVVRVFDESGNVIETHEHKGELKEW